MENKEKIEEMYFKHKMSLTEIAEQLKISISYVSRILRKNTNYIEEQNKRKEENAALRKQKQKNLIYESRRTKTRNDLTEYQFVKMQHNDAVKELSKKKSLGNDALRKCCSLYCYDKERDCYKFDDSKVLKPRDFPLYIKA